MVGALAGEGRTGLYAGVRVYLAIPHPTPVFPAESHEGAGAGVALAALLLWVFPRSCPAAPLSQQLGCARPRRSRGGAAICARTRASLSGAGEGGLGLGEGEWVPELLGLCVVLSLGKRRQEKKSFSNHWREGDSHRQGVSSPFYTNPAPLSKRRWVG